MFVINKSRYGFSLKDRVSLRFSFFLLLFLNAVHADVLKSFLMIWFPRVSFNIVAWPVSKVVNESVLEPGISPGALVMG